MLVDGKRLMPANGDGVTDLNIIPSALIESVEIITGGASAVYGSDALAGVVNFKLKRKVDGVEIDGTWGQTDRGDGTQYEAGLTAGTNFAEGRGSIVGYVGYADRELVTYQDRDFSRYPMAYNGAPGAQYTASPVASVILEASDIVPFDRADIQGFSASKDIKGDDHNLDVYAELLVPLLRDAPGAQSLEAVVGYRLSDYASAGSFDSWKAELIYQPIDAVRMRGSYQQAVRAPSVTELYLPHLPASSDFFFFPDQVDPCAAGSPARTGPDGAQVEALCLAQGIPVSVLPGFVGSPFVTGVTGGNTDLGPEEATTSTIGVVWTPRLSSALFSDLQVSLDWYEIDITDKIDLVPFFDFGQFCYDRRYNPDFSVTNQWCAMFSRNPVSGSVNAFQELNRNAYDWTTSGIDASG